MRRKHRPAKVLRAAPRGAVEEGSPVLAFTGERRDEHFTVLVRGRAVQLAGASLALLIDLVLARAETPTGFLPASPVEIRRLRRDIDKSLGAGAGKKLIAVGSGREYVLEILPPDIAGHVACAEPFFELIARHAVTEDQAKRLRAVLAAKKSVRSPQEISKKSSRNPQAIKKKSSGN